MLSCEISRSSEAAKNLSAECREARTDIPWRQIAGLRDRLIHGYFAINLELVFAVVESDLPPLREKISSWLDEC